MVAGCGETDVGSAGTQPTRDSRTEASKRRQGGATELHRCGSRRPALFASGFSISHGFASRSGSFPRPHHSTNLPARHFDASPCLPKSRGLGQRPKEFHSYSRDTKCPRKTSTPPPLLHRNSFDDIPGDAAFPPVIQSSRARVGMPGKILHVFQRHSLFQQIRDRGHPKRMGR